MQPEIHKYFRGIAEQYDIVPHIRFKSAVESAEWDQDNANWVVTITDQQTNQNYKLRSRAVVTAVGSLSVPNPCQIQGHEDFQGPLFHSATWDNTFDWSNKEVVVIGNGCSATQFAPIMTSRGPKDSPTPVKKLTQFSRQAHFLSERQNPSYSPAFKATMRYVPFAMRAYRAAIYYTMEKDFAGFDIETGTAVRSDLKRTNAEYVKAHAPQKYWNHLIPDHEIGCKRKVLDTDYLASLWRDNMTLIPNDPISSIEANGVRTKSGSFIPADAIVLATGFQTSKLLFPMTIRGQNGQSLEDHWNETYNGTPQAYLGTMMPGFPNLFTLMGPNTVTGHLSVIYTVECQIQMTLSLLEPIIAPSRPSVTSLLNPADLLSSPSSISRFLHPNSTAPKYVAVKPAATAKHTSWLQRELKKLVWSSGCTSWALDPKTGLNVAMYPQYQFLFWMRCLFLVRDDFEFAYRDGEGKGWRMRGLRVGEGWRGLRRLGWIVALFSVVLGLARRRGVGVRDVRGLIGDVVRQGAERVRGVLAALKQ
ncbi:hypothetical protein MBLNU457_1963t1 [Dothideomycetes sp. NU457]